MEHTRQCILDDVVVLVLLLYVNIQDDMPEGKIDICQTWKLSVLFYMVAINNGDKFFPLPASSTGGGSSAPSGPRPAGNRRSQGRTPFQSPGWQTGSRNNPVGLNVNHSTAV